MENKKGFYGWNVVFGAFLILALPFAIVFLSHSIFLTPVCEALGFSATQFSLVFTIVAIATAFMSPIIGTIIRKYNVKYVMAISGAITGLVFAGFGVATELWQFYVLSAILGIFTSGITQVPISYIVTNWFPEKKKGVATGIAFAGGNVGSLIVINLVTKLIPEVGYEKCYFILGGVMFVVTVLVSLFIIKEKPEDINQLPYGVVEGEIKAKVETDINVEGYTFKEAKSSPVFYVFILAIVLLGVVFAGVQMHIPSYMQSIGHSAEFASMVLSLVSIFGIFSNVLIGLLLEKAGLRTGMTIIGIAMLLAVVSLLLGETKIFAMLFGVIFGGFIAIASMGPSYLTSEIFGKKEYGIILGTVMMFFQLGGAVGPTLSGFIYDTTGAYQLTWIIFIVLLIITFGTFLFSISLANRNKKN